MFKLKIINKHKMIKMKCNIEFPDVILANLQEKEVVPTKEKQEIVPDKNYDGLSKVTVNPIPNEYIIPSGEIEFTQNGTYDVNDKASAKVNVPEKQLGTKIITTNGTYNARNDNLDGYSEVEVATSGVDINDYFLKSNTTADIRTWITKIPELDTSNITNMSSMFSGCKNLKELDTSNFDTSKVTNMSSMFANCSSLTNLDLSNFDTSKVTSMSSMFISAEKLETLYAMNAESVTNVYSMFIYANALVDFGGLINLGQSYSTTQSANYYHYTLDLSSCTKLTEQSLINVLNNLYDIASKGCKAQQLVLGSRNLAKLTSEEGQQALSNAQAKGWTVS